MQEEGKIHHGTVSSACPFSNGNGMSVLVGTGNNIWSGLYVISSTVGFIILVALLNVFYVNPFGVTAWWYKGLLFTLCMVAGVVIFGGPVIGLWHIWELRTSAAEEFKPNKKLVEDANNNETMDHKDLSAKTQTDSTTILYGTRPDFKGKPFLIPDYL